MFLGRAEEPEAQILEAFRLSPRDERASGWMVVGGKAKFRLGRDEEALARLNRLIEFNPNSSVSRFCLATLAHVDRVEEAREAARVCLEINPSFTIARYSGPKQRATIAPISRAASVCTKVCARPGCPKDNRSDLAADYRPRNGMRFCTARARCAFAEIVEFGDKQRLPARLVGEHVDLDVVLPFSGLAM